MIGYARMISAGLPGVFIFSLLANMTLNNSSKYVQELSEDNDARRAATITK